MIEKVISGAQTGADRGGLLAAMDLGIPIGGWCPRGRKAEDGAIPPEFNPLQETLTSDYPVRTECNVRDSDVTVIFSWGPRLSRGSLLTERMARDYDKPIAIVDAKNSTDEDAAVIVRTLIDSSKAKVVNVAGSRESKAPGIQSKVKSIMKLALKSQGGIV